MMRDGLNSDIICIYTTVVSVTIPHISIKKYITQQKIFQKNQNRGPLNAPSKTLNKISVVLVVAQTFKFYTFRLVSSSKCCCMVNYNLHPSGFFVVTVFSKVHLVGPMPACITSGSGLLKINPSMIELYNTMIIQFKICDMHAQKAIRANPGYSQKMGTFSGPRGPFSGPKSTFSIFSIQYFLLFGSFSILKW